MHSTVLMSLSVACVTGTLLAGQTFAEPQPPSEEQDPDTSFAESFLRKPYTGDLAIVGWTDFGGGLVSPPIYVHQYQREDGTFLILTSRETAPASRDSPASYVVTDALIVSKPWKGYAVSIACTQGEDFTLRFMGEARGPEEKEWWTEVRRAWEIELETGKIAETKTSGVKCTNPSW